MVVPHPQDWVPIVTERFAHTSVEETMGIGQHADHGHWQLSIHWRRVGVGVGSVTVLRRVGYSLG